MNKCDLYWLAGFLEGEGSFLKGPPSCPNLPIIRVSNTDEDVIDKASNLLEVSYQPISVKRSIKNGWKIPYCTRLKGRRAVDLMIKMRPLMGKRRKSQIDSALSCYKAKRYDITESIARKIKRQLKKKNLTQGNIAKKFKLTRETINKINRGKIWANVEV